MTITNLTTYEPGRYRCEDSEGVEYALVHNRYDSWMWLRYQDQHDSQQFPTMNAAIDAFCNDQITWNR